MFEIIKKSMLTGLGLAIVSKDKVEELVRELIEKGKLSEQEGRKLVAEMTDHADNARGEFEKQMEQYIQKTLDRMDIARKSDLKEIRASIMEIQQRLDSKENETGEAPA